jgi:D-3-phosphoglycerate dehydrogenase
MTSFEEVLRQSDFISLHLPALRGTHPLIDGSVLEQMKKGAFLINTARGELLDEVALLHALRRGQLAGAALDTFIEEPPGPANELINLPQVIATPHAGAHSAMECMGRQSLDDCIAVLSGHPPAFPVNCAQQ